MIRSLVALGLLVLAVPPVQAQAPESDDNRFQFHRADDGFIRLDLKTGQVSSCSRRTVGWSCQAAPDERQALEAEIARLQTESAALKKSLLDRGLALPGGANPEPLAREETRPLGDSDFRRMLATVEKAWRRLVELIETLQKDMLKKS